MLISALALVSGLAGAAGGGITPTDLAIAPNLQIREAAAYDWTLQRLAGGPSATSNQTANCNTGPISTKIGDHTDQYHDCGFD